MQKIEKFITRRQGGFYAEEPLLKLFQAGYPVECMVRAIIKQDTQAFFDINCQDISINSSTVSEFEDLISRVRVVETRNHAFSNVIGLYARVFCAYKDQKLDSAKDMFEEMIHRIQGESNSAIRAEIIIFFQRQFLNDLEYTRSVSKFGYQAS